MAAAHSSPSSFSAYFQVILVLPLLCLFLARVDAGRMNRSEEVNALLKFSQQFSAGPGPSNGNYGNAYWLTWNKSDETPCAWIGVSCTTNYTVDELHFSGWGIQVDDVTALNALRDLRVLDFSSNYGFYGVLGEICGNLTGLTWLDVSGTDLYNYALSGISACRNLRVLAVENSLIDWGPGLLTSMSDLVNLQILNLADNNLTGPFPKVELGDLSNLISLDLSGNGFDGSIPALPNLTRLVELKLDNNYFTGFEDPWSLGTKVLHELSVSNNLLEGMIPLSITNFPNLQLLNMSNNNLSGNIPSGYLGGQRNLSMSLDLSLNQLSGEIPPDLLNTVSPCDFLNLSYNLLTGNIPYVESSNGNCFWALDLSHNNLSGTILSSNLFDNSSSLIRVLHLHHNHLSGDIVDAVLLGSSIIMELRAESNLFTGDLSRIANATAHFGSFIDVLDLSDNRLQWSVSEAFPDPIMATLQVVTSRSALAEFRVGGNNFSGTSFPTACGVNKTLGEYYSSPLTILDLSSSHLEGEILGEAFDHTCLGPIQLLNLSNNHATGPLPTNFFAQFDPLSVVDVSNNSLSGPLPAILPSSNLYNPKYFLGNDGLCGGPLPPCPLPKQ